MNKHINIVALLHLVMGAMGLVAVGLILVLALFGFSIVEFDSHEAQLLVGILGTVFFVIMLVSTIPDLIVGYALLKRRSWARTATIVVSAMNLFAFPVGTALGGYSLWVMFQPEMARELGRTPGPVVTANLSGEQPG